MSEEKGKYLTKNTNAQETAIQHKLAAMFAANKDEVSIPKIYIDMTDDIEAAAVLDEIMFWTLPKRGTGKTSLRVFRDGHLWLAVRRSEWWERKRLKERQADLAIQKLVKLDLVEKDVFLFDGKPTVHIRLKTDNFVRLYGVKLQETVSFEDDQTITKDIADLYDMMGFPNRTVKWNSPNGEMLNSPNGEIINSLQQPENKHPSIDLSKSDIGWSILAGQMPSEQTIEENQSIKATRDAFESALNLPATWQWEGGTLAQEKALKKLTEFIVNLYGADRDCFTKYHTWRSQPFARGAVSNTALQRSPLDFIASWSDFVTATGYKVVHRQEVPTDDNGAPISY